MSNVKCKRKRQVIARLVLIFIAIIDIVSLFMDLYLCELIRNCLIKRKLWDTGIVIIVRLLIADDVGIIIDAFYIVWGAVITIAIFLIEISGTYQYGINLRGIIGLFWDRDFLKKSEIFYLILFPLEFFSCVNGFRVLSLWGLCVAFCGLIFVIGFVQRYTKRAKVQELILEKTKEELLKMNQEESICQIIDALPVTDMLVHIDYSNAYDQKMLANVLVEILTDKNIFQNTAQSSLRNIILMVWGRWMLASTSIQTEGEKECILNMFCDIWKELLRSDNKEIIQEEQRISYSLQLLIPFIDLQSEDGSSLLIRLWKRMNTYKSQVLIYLLLYSEFRYWFVDGKPQKWTKEKDYDLAMELNQLRKGHFIWEEDLGRKLWIDWGWCNGARGDIGIKQFYSFCKSLEQLADGGVVRAVVFYNL